MCVELSEVVEHLDEGIDAMLENSCTQADADDALKVVRLLKTRSGEALVWEQVEKVLLSEDGSSDSEESTDSLASREYESAQANPCCCSHSVADEDGHSLVRYDDDRLHKALLFIHRHLDESIRVQDITREVCVSRRWLEYAFRAAFGITPFQYLRCVRLELARLQLIREPQSKVHQIAMNTGFSSARQFTMTFRQYFGYSPSVCRSQGDGEFSAGYGPLAEAC